MLLARPVNLSDGRLEEPQTTMKNLTPHAIRIVRPDGSLLVEVPPSGQVARVATVNTPASPMWGPDGSEIPVCTQQTGAVTGLPPVSLSGVVITEIYLVSALVRLAHPERADLFSPGELVRGSDGQPTGCLGLVGNGGWV